MSETTYAIVFKGEILDGFQPISVKAHMAKLLKADADQMARLFSGKQIVLKRTADKAVAQKYGIALKKVGADVKLRVVQAEAAPEKPAAQAAATGSSAAAASTPASAPAGGELSLAPNEGNIFDPAPEAAAPSIDTSGITLGFNDGSPLAEPSEVPAVDLDLSGYSVSDNDGAPLVEPSDEPEPVIDVPDFGLDEPGAILETLKEEKELVNPNTMGMTLAMAGADLLEEEEKPKEPPPKVPDTSGINLVPNFDAG